MTARPVDPKPDESGASRKGKPSADRTDAVARVVREEIKRYPLTNRQPWDPPPAWGATEHTIADAILTTDDPAAVAALLATLAERHPDQYLTAGRDAGVLDENRKDVCRYCGVDYGDMHPRDCAFSRTARPSWVKRRRLVSEWREVDPQ